MSPTTSLPAVLDAVLDSDTPTVLTRDGEPVAIVLSLEEYARLTESPLQRRLRLAEGRVTRIPVPREG